MPNRTGRSFRITAFLPYHRIRTICPQRQLSLHRRAPKYAKSDIGIPISPVSVWSPFRAPHRLCLRAQALAGSAWAACRGVVVDAVQGHASAMIAGPPAHAGGQANAVSLASRRRRRTNRHYLITACRAPTTLRITGSVAGMHHVDNSDCREVQFQDGGSSAANGSFST